jgi:hypothetical protein
MTDNASVPGTGPDDSPTAPLPSPESSPSAPMPSPEVSSTAPMPASEEQPAATTWPPEAPEPVAASHSAQPAAIIAIVAGALVVVALAFGIGWTARGALDRTQAFHSRGFALSGQAPNGMPGGGGFGRDFPGGPGGPGGQGMGQGMPGNPGYRHGNGYGRGMRGWGQSPSQAPTRTAPGQLN